LELETTPAVYKVTLPPLAAPSMWLAGVDGIAGVDGVI